MKRTYAWLRGRWAGRAGRPVSGRLVGPLVWLAVLVGACAHESATTPAPRRIEARLDRLEQQERERKARLATLERQIERAERDLLRARNEAERYACIAKRSRVEAAVEVERLKCAKRVAEYARCAAENEANTATKTAAGCILGLAVAGLTGGAAGPAVLAGCGSGVAVSEATRRQCGDVPRCPSNEEIMARVLRGNGLSRMPECGTASVAGGAGASARLERSQGRSTGRGRRGAAPRRTLRVRGSCPRYRLDRIEVSAPRAKRGGAPWDADGSAPDIVVRIATDSGARTTTTKKRGYRVVARPRTRIPLSPGEGFEVTVVDQDLLADDTMARFRGRVGRSSGDENVTLDNGRTTVQVFFLCDAAA